MEIPKGIGTKVKYGNLLLFEEYKKMMALNCVNLSKSYTAWEEKKGNGGEPLLLDLLELRRSLEI